MTDHPFAVLRAYMAHVAESNLNPTDRLVAAALAAFTDVATGECFPSDKALSEITGLAERSHAGPRRRLIAAGLLERDVYGHGRRNHYRIVLDGPWPDDENADDSAPASAEWSTPLRASQRGVESSENDHCAPGSADHSAPASAPTAPGSAGTPRQPVHPLRAAVARHRRDREGTQEAPKREASKGRNTRGSEDFGEEDRQPMPPGWRASLLPTAGRAAQ